MIPWLNQPALPGLYLLAQAGSPRMLVLPTEGPLIGINLDPWRTYRRYTAHVLDRGTSIKALMMAPLDRGSFLLQMAPPERVDDPGMAVMGPEMVWGIRCLIEGGGTRIFWLPADDGSPTKMEWTGETLSFYWTITRNDEDGFRSILFQSGTLDHDVAE